MKQSLALAVDKKEAERAIAILRKLNLIDPRLRVRREGDRVLIPLSRSPLTWEREKLEKTITQLSIIEASFEEKVPKPTSIIDVLQKDLEPHELAALPKSYDIVGSIAIIEIPPELQKYEGKIGEALLKIYPNVKTVCSIASPVDGAFRIRKLKVIAGEHSFETIHREYGCAFKLDVTKVFFSPRLSYEHYRVARQVKDGEVVFDMFAGIGPYSIHIAKRACAEVFSVDWNPVAVLYLKENVKMNRVGHRIHAICGDSRDVASNSLQGVANRVIMNHPLEARKYVDAACSALASEGGVLHYYTFVKEPDVIQKAVEELRSALKKTRFKNMELLFARKVRPIASREWQVGLDVKLS